MDTLAARFLEEYRDNPLDLAEVLFLLPNRRACQNLQDAFVRLKGLQPTLLPRLMPLGEVEEDELLLTGNHIETALAQLPPAIDRDERLMLFTKIIMAKPHDFGIEKMSLNQACFLAQELARLIDTTHNENLSFDNLRALVPEEYAAHWQETLKFLAIITEYWPQILNERGLIDPAQRRNLLIRQQCALWQASPPKGRIIAAGTTATYPAMKELVKVILGLPRGEVILAGLDRHLEDEAWEQIDETHPQFELKQLLDYLGLRREDVADFTPPAEPEREKLIAEVMRPAVTTDRWRCLSATGISAAALAGLNVINTADIREEALAIALLMRQTLETPEKTAALVTPDRNLARRVAAELARWNIEVDDSAGRPLGLTPLGAFLRLAAVAAVRPRRVDLLALLKHPLCGLGKTYAEIRRQARNLEQVVWRGQTPDPGLENLLTCLNDLLGGFRELSARPSASLQELLAAHIQAAERLAATAETPGTDLLWRGEAGEAAADFLAGWYEQAGVLGEIEPREYLGLFEAMIAGITVRPRYGTHPRLRILGPIEARLSHYDTMIIGGVNETVWPQSAGSDPWLSRPMKKDFGFPLPEKAIGILALDFCNLLAAPEVYLTRADRVEGTPMVKSRWLMRLETVLKALNLNIETIEMPLYRLLARSLDHPAAFTRLEPPAPCPPVSARPRKLSASGIELLMRDPYSVFAKYILRLKPLEEIEPDLTMADYGTIIHGILEQFNNRWPAEFPANAREELLAAGRQTFAENNLALERRAFWWPAFEKIVDWLVSTEEEYRLNIRRVNNEVKGEYSWTAPAGKFTVTAKADRVDQTLDGKINIIDYKTGKARTPKEVRAGYAPQLPVEGLIAARGGFGSLPAAAVDQLIYWQLGRQATVIDGEMEQLLADTEQHLKELVNVFDFPSTAYICHPNPKRIPEYSDYEHLARVKEWSVQGGGDD